MTTIVTRASKGSALTWTEGDANITNLNNDKIELTNLSVTTAAAAETSALAYNNTTGQFTFTPVAIADLIGLVDLSVGTPASASGSGSISYNNTTGVFTYTPPTAAGIGALANVVEDTTPQLGGNLDANGNRITALKYRETVYEQLSASGTLTIDAANGNTQYVEVAGNITINGLANASAGDTVTILLDNLGAYTLTSTMLFAGGVNTITANGLDVLSIFTPDGVTFLASLAQDFQ